MKNCLSPVNGAVFNLIPSSKGYAVSEGEVLKIVPDGEAKVFSQIKM